MGTFWVLQRAIMDIHNKAEDVLMSQKYEHFKELKYSFSHGKYRSWSYKLTGIIVVILLVGSFY